VSEWEGRNWGSEREVSETTVWGRWHRQRPRWASSLAGQLASASAAILFSGQAVASHESTDLPRGQF
jgi:hypothetical protein